MQIWNQYEATPQIWSTNRNAFVLDWLFYLHANSPQMIIVPRLHERAVIIWHELVSKQRKDPKQIRPTHPSKKTYISNSCFSFGVLLHNDFRSGFRLPFQKGWVSWVPGTSMKRAGDYKSHTVVKLYLLWLVISRILMDDKDLCWQWPPTGPFNTKLYSNVFGRPKLYAIQIMFKWFRTGQKGML